MPDTQRPTATVAGQSIALHVTGYPDIPNRWGTGHIRATGIRLDYGNNRTPNGRHAFVTGLWIREDGEPTTDPIDRYYDAPDGDMTDWPDWLAELTRQYTPAEAQQPEPEAPTATEHTGGNAEDCPVCRPEIDKTVLYPWICRGAVQQPAAADTDEEAGRG